MYYLPKSCNIDAILYPFFESLGTNFDKLVNTLGSTPVFYCVFAHDRYAFWGYESYTIHTGVPLQFGNEMHPFANNDVSIL